MMMTLHLSMTVAHLSDARLGYMSVANDGTEVDGAPAQEKESILYNYGV
jgi:hypothetical protein